MWICHKKLTKFLLKIFVYCRLNSAGHAKKIDKNFVKFFFGRLTFSCNNGDIKDFKQSHRAEVLNLTQNYGHTKYKIDHIFFTEIIIIMDICEFVFVIFKAWKMECRDCHNFLNSWILPILLSYIQYRVAQANFSFHSSTLKWKISLSKPVYWQL